MGYSANIFVVQMSDSGVSVTFDGGEFLAFVGVASFEGYV